MDTALFSIYGNQDAAILAGRLGISYLYITRARAVARYMRDRIGVMYLGKVVEVGETESRCRFCERCPIVDDFRLDNDHPPLKAGTRAIWQRAIRRSRTEARPGVEFPRPFTDMTPL